MPNHLIPITSLSKCISVTYVIYRNSGIFNKGFILLADIFDSFCD
jgi:hypothetical protein